MPSPAEPAVAPYRPSSLRRRLLVAALAVATAVGVVALLLDPPGGVQRPRVAPSSPAAATPAPACAPGQSEGCVGGTSMVIRPVAPAAPLASASR